MYLTKHPCTSIVVVFSPRPNIYALVTAPPWGLEKEDARKPCSQKLCFRIANTQFCTRGIAVYAHHLYSDRRGACDEKKMSGSENQTSVGFSKHVTFISD